MDPVLEMAEAMAGKGSPEPARLLVDDPVALLIGSHHFIEFLIPFRNSAFPDPLLEQRNNT